MEGNIDTQQDILAHIGALKEMVTRAESDVEYTKERMASGDTIAMTDEEKAEIVANSQKIVDGYKAEIKELEEKLHHLQAA